MIDFEVWWHRLSGCIKEDRMSIVQAKAVLGALLREKGLVMPYEDHTNTKADDTPDDETLAQMERTRLEIQAGWDEETRAKRMVDDNYDPVDRFLNLANANERRVINDKRNKDRQREKRRMERERQREAG